MLKKTFVEKRKTTFVTRYDYGNGVVDLEEFVLSYATSCNLGCQYCYLNFVKTPKEPILYENKDKMFEELEELVRNPLYNEYYLNCGETADSFLTDEYIKLAGSVVDFLSFLVDKYNKKVTIEFRTKTGNIDKISPVKSKNIKVIYATSLVPEKIRKNVEIHTINIEDRIKNLTVAVDKGMGIGLRFEPIIMIGEENNETEVVIRNLLMEYEELIFKTKDIISKNVNRIHSISLSVLRFTKQQFKDFIAKKSKLVWPEMVLCPDGKYRYSRYIRIEIYKKIIELLMKYFGDNIVSKTYLATEFKYIWCSCGLEIKKMVNF
jgi:DNA repair photolyase